MISVTKDGNISVKIIADSVSIHGQRITTFELEYPRFVHSELMTHRMFSRNAASSRAIPVNKVISIVEDKPALPVHWGKNQSGMIAKEENTALVDEGISIRYFDGETWQRKIASCDQISFRGIVNSLPENPIKGDLIILKNTSIPATDWWLLARDRAIDFARGLADAKYHKQIVNRILEPFTMIKVVVTATEMSNFFCLRAHPDAQPEIKELAVAMYDAFTKSIPVKLDSGEWHMPYYRTGFWSTEMPDSLEDALKISASCCAQVSYRVLNDSLDKAEDIYIKLIESKPCHASPTEHQATPMRLATLQGAEFNPANWEAGVTHLDSSGAFWSGNFKGWIQHRQHIPGHVYNGTFVVELD